MFKRRFIKVPICTLTSESDEATNSIVFTKKWKLNAILAVDKIISVSEHCNIEFGKISDHCCLEVHMVDGKVMVDLTLEEFESLLCI